jgi:lipopolysaccharide/colanic/teichoic acid biosynthesis glycosyltransferase
MNLQQTLHYSLLTDSSKKMHEDSTIKSAAEFHTILQKERARADRNNHVFSLVSFEFVPQVSGRNSTIYFAYYLKNRIRITDEIGWQDNHSIGILLFNTLDKEAKQFAESIQRNCPPNIICKYSVSTYPEDKVEHAPNEQINRGSGAGYNSMPGSTSLHAHPGGADEKIAKNLNPVFYHKISVAKRLSDVVLSTVALLVLSPLMFIIAVAVKLTSKGPIFYKQQRAGLGGLPFTMLKFRTMKVGADEMKSQLQPFNERTGPVFKMENDPRVTRFGKILRHWSLDELPQFLNVLNGDMSLVGPRPPTMDEVEQYRTWHNYRLEMRPGITCIWQVYARHDKSFDNWVRLDIKYRQEQSFLLDMKLIVLTLPAVLSRRGAS